MDDSPTQRDSWEGPPLNARPRRHSIHEELTQSRSSATQHRDKPDSATTTKTHHQKEWTTALPRETHGTAHQDPRPRGRSNHEELTQSSMSRPSATQYRDKPDSATTNNATLTSDVAWHVAVTMSHAADCLATSRKEKHASTFLATRKKTFCMVASCKEGMSHAQFSPRNLSRDVASCRECWPCIC